MVASRGGVIAGCSHSRVLVARVRARRKKRSSLPGGKGGERRAVVGGVVGAGWSQVSRWGGTFSRVRSTPGVRERNGGGTFGCATGWCSPAAGGAGWWPTRGKEKKVGCDEV